MTVEAERPRGPVGRPRRFAEQEERLLLIEAGIEVMQRNGFANASVADVLEVAGVSTRAFYRHFDSKDALLLAIWRREAEATAADLQRAVDREEDSVEAIKAWLIAFLELFRNRKKAQRVAAMVSEAARRAVGYEEEENRTKQMHVSSLAGVIQLAVEEGRVVSPDVRRDALAVYGIAVSTIEQPGVPLTRKQYAAALATLDRFVWPALGLSTTLVGE